MKTWFAAAVLSAASLTAGAANRASKEEAVVMVKKAVAMVKTQGREKTFAAISDPANASFHDRDLYIYVYDFNGVVLAHGNNPQMVGKSRIELRDNEGKPMIKEMIAIAKNQGSGWVNFNWPNPVTKTVELKAGYIERVDNFLIGSGAYK